MDLMTFKQFDAQAMTIYDHEASRILEKDYWCVVNSFRYYVGSLDSGMYVQVPKGYLTDGASVPQVFWNLLPPWSSYGQAAITHDFLCDYGEVMLNDEPTQINRKEVDRILAEAMKVLGVKPWKRFVISNAVSLHRVVTGAGANNITEDKRRLELARSKQMYLSEALINKQAIGMCDIPG